ncbi:MAG: bifunctional 3-deoxy-7-phosphoheptulonate synthase/chorismate mutase type II [Culturomica sp.]|jgi:chorismate mutase|nr:bifunctional 3-deoxy-7-phosphoheptulonate synthase/chorismate mutase type II [Culturomica sp.]
MSENELNICKPERWGIFSGTERPFLIAGPCSAESEEQVFKTAKALKENGIGVFRAGIWKPRTRPDCFEGAGSEGFAWLRRVQQELGMKTATEVANAKHVHEALKAGVDLLWIGARTTANPFAVQELADALAGTDIPVLVKNPVNPDVDLWLGAVERLQRAGLTKVGIVHRGFSVYRHSKYRNAPQWQLPIEVRRRYRELPLICDPSHIAGNRAYLQEISQQALDLGFDGLMLESHICPEIALSDAQQQVTPAALKKLIDNLVVRAFDSTDVSYNENIDELRNRIDQLDDELLNILSQRMRMAVEIGRYKKQKNITILQAGRWEQILEKVFRAGEQKGLEKELLEKVFCAIHEASINKQTEVMNELKN